MRSFGKLGARVFAALLAAVFSVVSLMAEDEKKEDVINVPIPVGEDAMGLRIPLYDQKGNLTMTLEIERAQKIDESRMLMEDAIVQTFTENNKPDLRIGLPESIIDLRTSVVTSESPVTIEREDFRLTGNAMEFDLKSKKGRVIRNVKMLIYSRDNFSRE